MLPKGPEWQCKPWETTYPMKKLLHLYYCDPLECIQSILYHPLVKDFIRFAYMNQLQKPCVSTLSGLAAMLHGRCRLVSPFKKESTF